MRLKHILVEGYCNFDEAPDGQPCAVCNKEMGVHCLECPQFSYAPAPYELAMSNGFGLVEKETDWVAPYLDIGDHPDATEEMVDRHRQIWANVCQNKISEAWNEFCEKTKQNNCQ